MRRSLFMPLITLLAAACVQVGAPPSGSAVIPSASAVVPSASPVVPSAPGSPTDPPSDPLTASPAGLSTPSTAPTLPPGPLPSAPATPDVFCQKYVTTIEWADASDDIALRPYLVELLRRLDDMRSVAPSFLLDDMDVLIAYAAAVQGEDYASVYALMKQVPGAAASLNRHCSVAENPLMEF